MHAGLTPCPLQAHLLAQHVVGFQSLPLETPSFLLTLLAAMLTPTFVLSRHWAHLPCGCAIDCEQNPAGKGGECGSHKVLIQGEAIDAVLGGVVGTGLGEQGGLEQWNRRFL